MCLFVLYFKSSMFMPQHAIRSAFTMLICFHYVPSSCCLSQGVSHTPSEGLIPPIFAQHPPASGGKEGEKGRRGRGKGKGKEKGRDPQGLVDTPTFQILKNTLPFPVVCTDVPGQYRHFYSLQTNRPY